MSQRTDLEEGFLEGASSIEEAENCDINLNFICSFPGEVVENKADEETEMCSEEFSNLSIDCSEEWIAPEDTLKMRSKSSNPSKELNQIDAALDFFDKDFHAEDLLSLEESESFDICDLNRILTNIKAFDSEDLLGRTELKTTSDEKRQNFIDLGKSTQNNLSVDINRNSKLTKRVLKKFSKQSAEYLDNHSQTLSKVDYENASKNSVSGVNTSKTVIEQSTSSAETSENGIETSKNIISSPNVKKIQLIEAFIYLEHITRLVNSIESMNNYLTKLASSLINRQQTLQELINIVNEYLAKLKFLPSSVILVNNEYTFGKINFNVETFGQGIFQTLKSSKKEINGTFREFIAFRKDFRYVSRTFCLIPFESTLDHEMQTTLDRTVEMYNKICRVFKKSEHTEIIEGKIISDTLSLLLRVKEFENYLNILNDSQSNERMV